jgi:hypothetical protein
MRPEDPELVVPVVKERYPLTPVVPAFGVPTTKDPLLVAVDKPVVILIKPPVCVALVPLDNSTSPPVSDVAVPTLILTSPALPVAALPLDIEIAPEDPELVVPVINCKCPLTPVVPASTVFTTNAPLEDVLPFPVLIDIKPPVVPAAVEVSPAYICISPPVPTAPVLTLKVIRPDFPAVADPVETEIVPELPELDVPVENEIEPLTPEVPAFCVFRTMLPLELAVP